MMCRLTSYLLGVIGGIAILLMASAASASDQSIVAEYLTGAECQHETDQQKSEIAAAMRDMLDLSAMTLRKRRYRTYTGIRGQWTILTLLKRYCVPEHQVDLDETLFYREFQRPSAKLAIQTQLTELR